MELLYDWLSDAQRKELALEDYFTITGESSGKRYQVHKVHSFGLKELDDAGSVVASFCVVPAGTHALGDTMLAQKIWMETDEETTLARANRMGALGPTTLLGMAGQEMQDIALAQQRQAQQLAQHAPAEYAARMYPDA